MALSPSYELPGGRRIQFLISLTIPSLHASHPWSPPHVTPSHSYLSPYALSFCRYFSTPFLSSVSISPLDISSLQAIGFICAAGARPSPNRAHGVLFPCARRRSSLAHAAALQLASTPCARAPARFSSLPRELAPARSSLGSVPAPCARTYLPLSCAVVLRRHFLSPCSRIPLLPWRSPSRRAPLRARAPSLLAPPRSSLCSSMAERFSLVGVRFPAAGPKFLIPFT
jgi:hypothetical protein